MSLFPRCATPGSDGAQGRRAHCEAHSGWSRSRHRVVAVIGTLCGLSACTDPVSLPPEAGMGRSPTLPPPTSALLPTVHIAPAQAWPAGTQPVPMNGLRVTALATGLDHPLSLIHI